MRDHDGATKCVCSTTGRTHSGRLAVLEATRIPSRTSVVLSYHSYLRRHSVTEQTQHSHHKHVRSNKAREQPWHTLTPHRQAAYACDARRHNATALSTTTYAGIQQSTAPVSTTKPSLLCEHLAVLPQLHTANGVAPLHACIVPNHVLVKSAFHTLCEFYDGGIRVARNTLAEVVWLGAVYADDTAWGLLMG